MWATTRATIEFFEAARRTRPPHGLTPPILARRRAPSVQKTLKGPSATFFISRGRSTTTNACMRLPCWESRQDPFPLHYHQRQAHASIWYIAKTHYSHHACPRRSHTRDRVPSLPPAPFPLPLHQLKNQADAYPLHSPNVWGIMSTFLTAPARATTTAYLDRVLLFGRLS